VDRALESMTPEECLILLGSTPVGRVAVTEQALPAVVPVNFVLHGNAVVFRTRPDGLLARACDNTVVAFEIDEVQPNGRAGWSVLVVGMAEVLSGSQAVRANQLNLASAAGDGNDIFVSITIGRLTGRRAGNALAVGRQATGPGRS
jgi:nitroimidazol reductase NimA-like FMN-containing flavoprotein (pyridoxamine 5'-phosphate oxidase superfamily)